MSAAKKEHHDYLVECLDCTRDVKRGERCSCGASTLMIDRVNESLKRAHEKRDGAGIYPELRPVIVRAGGKQ